MHEDYVEILGGDVNHMKNVLRMKPGEEVTVSDGFGHEYGCKVALLEEDAVRAEILELQGSIRRAAVGAGALSVSSQGR